MDGPLASISENRIASGVRIKHVKGQNKTKQSKTNKHKQKKPQSERGNWNQVRDNETT